MIMTFKRPMFVTDKYIDVHWGQKKIGKMRYYRHHNAGNPKFDVNIAMIGSDQTYEIIQQSFSIKDGSHWHIVENGDVMADMRSGKFKEVDQVNAQLDEDTALGIKAKSGFKVNATITINDEHIGNVSTKGLFFERYYEMKLDKASIAIDSLLLAGITYAFFSSSNFR